MKTFILLATVSLVLLVSSCNQNSPAPSNSGSSNNTTPPTPTSSFTSADSAISGNWILDVTEIYSLPTGTLVVSMPHSDPANCHLDLQLVITDPNFNRKQGVDGLNCGPYTAQWRLLSGDLELQGGIFIIKSQSSTNLVLERSSGSTKFKFYLHK